MNQGGRLTTVSMVSRRTMVCSGQSGLLTGIKSVSGDMVGRSNVIGNPTSRGGCDQPTCFKLLVSWSVSRSSLDH